MKQRLIFILLSGWILLGGCAASSPFTGKWRAVGLPANMQAGGANVMDINLRSDGTFMANLKTPDLKKTVETLRGVWAQNTIARIEFRVLEPPSYTIGTGLLMGEDTLLCIGAQSSIQFYKLK